MKFLCLLVVFSVAMLGGQALTPSTFLSTVDKDRLKRVFQAALGNTDELPSLQYAILGYKLLGETAPDGVGLCRALHSFAGGAFKNVDAKSPAVGNLYHAAVAGEALACALKPSSGALQALSAGLSGDGGVSSLFHSVLALQHLGQPVDSAAVLKVLHAGLKKDDGLSNLGYAFNLASILAGENVSVKSIFERIEDAIVQADEVDGQMYQFEGGLTVTNLILTGAYKLAEKIGKAPPISGIQATKFANYFLSRKSVQAAKGSFYLLDALSVLSSNPFHVPVAMTLASGATVSEDTPAVRVRITDVVGNPIKPMDVVVSSAIRQSDGATVMAKTKMAAVAGDPALYEVDMMAAKPGRGFYDLTLTATPQEKDERLTGNTNAVLLVKALTTVSIENVELGIVDADGSSAPKLAKLTHPDKLKSALVADRHHKLILKFALKDKSTGDAMKVHQSFVRLSNAASGAEIIYVAEADSTNLYKFDLDVSAKAKEFGSRSGKYELTVILGDAVISNPVAWTLADIDLSFPDDAAADGAEAAEAGPKPEIRHKFREPEKRPPALVSNAFTLLCIAPIIIMFALWMRLGVNISSFPYSLPAIGFHAGLGTIFTLYYYFWLELNMFTTMKYLIMIGVVTFLCGNSMLVKIAEKRKQQHH